MKTNKEKLFEIMKEGRYGMLITFGDVPMARPMEICQSSFEDRVYFLSVLDSEKIEQMRKNSEVLVTFSCHERSCYASLLGQARLNMNIDEIQEHYDLVHGDFFTKIGETEGLCLVEIVVKHAECWYCDKTVLNKVIQTMIRPLGDNSDIFVDRFSMNL